MAGILFYEGLLIVLGIIDIKSMLKAGLKKEIIPYILLFVLSAVSGFLYLLNPHGKSLIRIIFDVLGIER